MSIALKSAPTDHGTLNVQRNEKLQSRAVGFHYVTDDSFRFSVSSSEEGEHDHADYISVIVEGVSSLDEARERLQMFLFDVAMSGAEIG